MQTVFPTFCLNEFALDLPPKEGIIQVFKRKNSDTLHEINAEREQ